jgi:hypothetical protein
MYKTGYTPTSITYPHLVCDPLYIMHSFRILPLNVLSIYIHAGELQFNAFTSWLAIQLVACSIGRQCADKLKLSTRPSHAQTPTVVIAHPNQQLQTVRSAKCLQASNALGFFVVALNCLSDYSQHNTIARWQHASGVTPAPVRTHPSAPVHTRTCPKLAAATGWGLICENTADTGRPSSCSRTANAQWKPWQERSSMCHHHCLGTMTWHTISYSTQLHPSEQWPVQSASWHSFTVKQAGLTQWTHAPSHDKRHLPANAS